MTGVDFPVKGKDEVTDAIDCAYLDLDSFNLFVRLSACEETYEAGTFHVRLIILYGESHESMGKGRE